MAEGGSMMVKRVQRGHREEEGGESVRQGALHENNQNPLQTTQNVPKTHFG